MKKNLILVGLTILIVSVVAATLIFSLFSHKKTANTLFLCTTLEELERFAEQNNVAYEKADHTVHLYNVEVAGQSGYCIAESQPNTNTLKKITFYTIVENNENVMEVIETVRLSFCEEYGLSGEYEYYPLNDQSNAISDNEFFRKEASKELFIHAENTTWNISWVVTDDGVSGKICKDVA